MRPAFSRVSQISSIFKQIKMSAVISDADFEREMYNLHMSFGEQCHYSKWHKTEPAKPLREMIREMTKIREESEEEASKRAMEDLAWEDEKEVEADAEDNVMPCLYCDEPVPYGICDPCDYAMREYGAIQCVSCEAYWTTRRTPPCVKCHPRYIADFRAAEAAATVAPAGAAAAAASMSDEDTAWYKAKQAEWDAYAIELEAESNRSAPEEEEDTVWYETQTKEWEAYIDYVGYDSP